MNDYPTFQSMYSGAGMASPAATAQPAGAGGVGSGVIGQDPSIQMQGSGGATQDMAQNPWGKMMDMWSQGRPANAQPNIGGGK